MTVSSQPHPGILRESAPPSLEPRVPDARAAWRTWAILVVTIGALYLLMYNPYWVPGGDSEVYIAVGRSWATHQGHSFNGQFVSICPPGWPWVLALGMKISASFGFLKLITIMSMTFAMGFWYWFLLRFATRRHAAALTLLTAIISHVYSLSFWMHSDALFCLIATAAMVVACQINERRSHPAWRIALLVILCILAQLVRWAGVLQWLVIGGILVRGYALPLSRKRATEWLANLKSAAWIGLFVSLVVNMGTFEIARHALSISHEEKIQAEDAGATFDETQQTAESKTVDIINGAQNKKMTFSEEMIKRVRESGKWFSWLLWPEMRFAGGVKVLSSIDTVCGWLLIVPLVVTGYSGVRKREWMWLGVTIYCAALCLNWPNPNARYLVPIAPLLIWGILHGIRIIFARYGQLKFAPLLIGLLMASVAIANLALYSVDVWVARSRDFYGAYEAGMDESLISCVKFLNNRGINDGELGVSEFYQNLGRRRPSKFGLRATVMLSDRIVKNVPGKYEPDDVTKAKFINWARSRHLKYFLIQQPISPWRVWHFQIPASLQKTLSREEVAPPSAGWVLYRYVPPVSATIPLPMPHVVTIAPQKWVKVDVPIVHNWPTHVPGME